MSIIGNRGRPDFYVGGHNFAHFRAVAEPNYFKCVRCGLKTYELGDVGTTCPEAPEGSFTQPIQPGAPITDPCIAVPPDFQGSDAEAVGIAVAAAVQHIALQRDSWESYCRTTRDKLAKLAKEFPATSFAGSNVALLEAQEWLAEVGPHLDPQKPEQRT